MPDDQSNSAHLVRPRLGRGEEGGPLSRQLAHIGLQQLVRLIRLGSGLAYSRVSGLSDFEWRVLARACDLPGLSINELGVVLRRGGPQVSRTVKRLVAAGLLNRARCAGGPGVAITPTPLGKAVYAPLATQAIQNEKELTTGLSDEDRATLDRCIAVMTQNALTRLAREQALLGDGAAEVEESED